jgi:hypothetical protein
MTLESLEAAGIARGLFTSEEYGRAPAEMKKMESDPLAFLTKFPDIWVIAANH